ncbi:MAG: lysophospholipid acyltransferase family protein [Halieaceae bacterium]|jgi:KDO2-lipid IV(A) lauroyltransferase|nr:lysophospholipid acyltransferase family protein [Halieaceae bacterium]
MRALLRALAALPEGVAQALSSLAYLLAYHLLRYRRATVRENLAQAFPQKTVGERLQIERAFYRYFCDLLLEILRSTRMPSAAFAEGVSFRNPELLFEVTNQLSSQAILLLIHQGNWEWSLHSAMQHLGAPVDPVYKPLHSPFWDQLILEARSRFGATPMTIASVGREVVRGRGRRRLIALLADQAGPRHGGFWTEFLGRPASFYRGPEKLARALALPLLFAQCRRLSRGRYEIEFHLISLPPHDSEGDALLKAYVDLAQRCIAEQPETYLWTNRRWKKKPPEDWRAPTARSSSATP